MRDAVEAFNALHRERFVACFSASAAIFPLRHPVEGTVFEGAHAAAAYWAAVREAWETIRWEASEYRDLGDSVLMLGRLRAVGRGTGIPVEGDGGAWATFENGAITRLQVFSERSVALEATGQSD